MPEGAWFLFLLKKRFFLKLLFCPFRDFRGGLDFISHSLHPRIYKESDNKTYLKKKKTVQSTEMVSEKGQFLILVSDAKKRVRHGLMAAAEQDLFA